MRDPLKGWKHLLYTSAGWQRCRRRRPVQAKVSRPTGADLRKERSRCCVFAIIDFSLGALALFAMAVGAGCKPN